MAIKTVECARCHKTVTRKSTIATEVKMTKVYNRTSKLSYRGVEKGVHGKGRERAATPAHVSSTRMCRKKCGG